MRERARIASIVQLYFNEMQTNLIMTGAYTKSAVAFGVAIAIARVCC